MRPAAYALFDRAALKANLARVRQIAPQAKVMAVIKANAYGHGLFQVAQHLDGVDALAVARVEEGKQLRELGLKQRIVVLEGFVNQDELALARQLDLELVIHGDHQLELIQTSLESPMRLWLKLDSGMHRLGFDREGFLAAFDRLHSHPHVIQLNVLTHLANADDPDDGMTLSQLNYFADLTRGLPAAEYSIANSAGVLAWPDSHADWIRPGIMLYGASPFAGKTGEEVGLRPVMTFCSRLIAVKNLAADEPVGYGGTWQSDHPIRIGVAAAGYGDGYPRQVPSGTPVLVNNQRVSLVGRVSMDMITLDLTNCPEAKPGDPVVLWGEGLPVEEIATYASTIPYTLLCGITQRVRFFETHSVIG